MSFSELIFDFDGTLVDSSQCIFTVYRRLFAELGRPEPRVEDMYKFIGPTIEQTIGEFFEGDPEPVFARFRKIYRTIDLVKTNFLYPGIYEMLTELKQRGFRLYVGTLKGEEFAIKILEGLGARHLFDAVYGSNHEIGRVEKHLVLNALIDERHLDRDKCLLIGDTKYDVDGAKKSRIQVGIVTYGFGKQADYADEYIRFLAESVPKLHEKLRGYNG